MLHERQIDRTHREIGPIGIARRCHLHNKPFPDRTFHQERITGFERPSRLGYLILESRPLPIRHERGEITLAPYGDGTRVIWESVGHVDIPVLGRLLLDRFAEESGRRAFSAFLRSIDRRPAQQDPE